VGRPLLRSMVRASAVLLGGLGLLAAADAFHAGLLVVPDFDEVVMMHLPPTTPNNAKPNMMHKSGSEQHLFDLPKFHKPHGEAHKDHEQEHSSRGLQRMNSVNEKLIQADLAALANSKKKKPNNFHAGSWLVEEPKDFVNLELEPIGYSRKWLGEEKLGGSWSSKENPLSGDREFLIKKMKTMGMDDTEKEAARGMAIHTAIDGTQHVMPKKA